VLPSDWSRVLSDELSSPWFRALEKTLAVERKRARVFPEADEVFEAFRLTAFEQVRVVVLGQDPYHREGQAHGLAFSVRPGIKPPPSLKNIYKELRADLGGEIPSHGCLTHWSEQGVLLLNTVLTVREGEAGSHQGLGWEQLTDAVISKISQRDEHAVFALWGAHARKKAKLIDLQKHSVLEAAHPSPLSQGKWFGSRPFSAINAALESHGQRGIEWLAQ
jgi:uracil-DNA glycosylase